jgi:hypothetical protein
VSPLGAAVSLLSLGAFLAACAPSREPTPPSRTAGRAEVVVPAAPALAPSPPPRARPAPEAPPLAPETTAPPAVADAVDEDPASELPGIYPSLASLCTEHMNRSVKRHDELLESAKSLNEKLRAPSCTVRGAPVPFAGDGTYLSASTLVVSDGLSSHSLIAARLRGGFVATAITWAWDDPSDPGCPSIVRPVSVLGLSVENGRLVAVIGGETTMYADAESDKGPTEDGVRSGLVRTVTWCKAGDAEVRCRTHGPPNEQGLGWKIQPHRSSEVAWAALPWKDFAAFSIGDDGELHTAAKLAP